MTTKMVAFAVAATEAAEEAEATEDADALEAEANDDDIAELREAREAEAAEADAAAKRVVGGAVSEFLQRLLARQTTANVRRAVKVA